MLAALALAAFACGCQSTAKLMWEQPGPVSPKTPGWSFTPSKNKGKLTFYKDEGYYLDRGGKLAGPQVPLSGGEFRFFRYTFKSKSPVRCYWAMDFYDASGELIKGDCYASIYPSTEPVENTGVLYGRVGTASVVPFFASIEPLSVSDLRIEQITPAQAAEWCDVVYAGIPPLDYTPPAGRLRYIPKTMNALKTGKPWRMLVFGHSLYNDTYNSNFPALLKRLYPKSNLMVHYSGRGATGCEYYQDHVDEYVVACKPDVVIVNGLARGNTIEPIASVVRQIREKIGCEMILMTEPFGWDIRDHKDGDLTTPLPKQTIDADAFFKARSKKFTLGPVEFTRVQRKFAEEERIAFLDAKTVWYGYLSASAKPWNWFNRDSAHASDRGKQVVGRIIERFFDDKLNRQDSMKSGNTHTTHYR